jgi:hypothetical protein
MTRAQIIQHAQSKLAELAGRPLGLQGVWVVAALKTIVSGEIVDPPASDIERLLPRPHVWTGVEDWHPEDARMHIKAVQDTLLFAIATDDVPWIEEIDRRWSGAANPWSEEDRVHAQGQIGLALGSRGRRPHGWTSAEISDLRDEHYLRIDEPVDRAWLALADRRVHDAASALQDARRRRDDWFRRLAEDSEGMALRSILICSGEVLRLDLRALERVIETHQHGDHVSPA